MNYREDQLGWNFIIILSVFMFVILTLHIFQIGNNPLPLTIAIVFIVFTLILTLLFFRLSVIVNKDYIKIRFGIGLIRKKFNISDISEVKKVRTKWYNGWGIRYVRNGWLYNIQGFNAVELMYKNRKKRVLIGTKPNSNLEREIKRALGLIK